MNFLKGHLTYIMAAIAVVWGVVGYFTHWTDGATSLNAIWTGLAVFGLRRAVS